jgi:fibronectin-binding autotransporter adhesin
LSDYAIGYVTTTGTIAPRGLTIDLNNVTKAYDGTNIAFANGGVAEAGSSSTGLVASDAITGITGNGTYNSAHVLSADAASFALANLTIGLSGNNLSDYSVALVQPAGAAITPAPVSVKAVPQTKVYDSTTASNAPITNITGIVPGDSLTGLTQAYTNANVLGPNGSTLVVNGSNMGVTGNHTSALSDYAISYYTSPGTITPAPLTVSNVTLNSDGTLNISGAVVSGVVSGQTLVVVYGSVFGTVAVVGPEAGNYMVINPYVTVPPLVYIPNWLGALHAAQRAVQSMAMVWPPAWITVTQSPQSLQMLQVADTGQPPTVGPTRLREAGPSSSNVYCIQGAIRMPSGVRTLPVENCSRPSRAKGT